MNELSLLQQVIDRWITMGQALVASIGALAFVLAFLWKIVGLRKGDCLVRSAFALKRLGAVGRTLGAGYPALTQ